MKHQTRYAITIAAVFWLAGGPAQGQMILVGSTGNVTATSGTSHIVDIDLMTGAATNPRDTGIFVLAGIATQPSTGILFGLTTLPSTPPNTLVTINPWTGAYSIVGPTGLSSIVEGDLAFNPIDGMLYGIQDAGPMFNERNLFRLNPSTGQATTVGSIGTSGDYSALAFDSIGNLYTIDSGVPGNSVLQKINPASGNVMDSLVMNVNLVSGVGMTFDPITGIAYVADGGQENGARLLYTLEVLNGVLVPIGPTNIAGGISGLSFITVPEPSGLHFVAVGFAFVVRRLRRLLL
jgi:hypothetical protein